MSIREEPFSAERPSPAPSAAMPGGVPEGAVACANCGAALTGPYCAHCGQRANAGLIAVREIFRDTLEDQFAWNSAVPRTAYALLLKPGFLTREYVAGHIVRYVPPMRIYLAASLLFFLALSFVASPDRLASRTDFEVVAGTPENVAGRPAAAPASAAGSAAAAQPSVTRPNAQPAAAQSHKHGFISIDTAAGPEWLRTRLAAQQRRLNAMDRKAAIRSLVAAFWDMAPKVAFVLLPVLALILKVLYIRRRRLYVEHFVFSLHVQSVAFLAFTVVVLARNGWLGLALFLALTAYTYLAMLRVYGQGWFRTLLKFGILSWTYFLALSTGMVIGLLGAVLSV